MNFGDGESEKNYLFNFHSLATNNWQGTSDVDIKNKF